MDAPPADVAERVPDLGSHPNFLELSRIAMTLISKRTFPEGLDGNACLTCQPCW